MATDNPGHNRSDVTGAVSSTHAAGRSNWSWQGGTAVMVEQGETLDSISKRYGVPASAIMQANAMTGPASLQPGQRLVIPRYTQNGAPNLSTPSTRIASNSTTIPSTTGTNFSSKPVHVPTATAGVHVVAPGETLSSIARLYGSLGRILSAETLELGRRELSRGLCAVTLRPYVFGVGFELQTELGRLGPPPRAFGHTGSGGSSHGAWPDERTGFSYAMTELRAEAVDDRATRVLAALAQALRERSSVDQKSSPVSM